MSLPNGQNSKSGLPKIKKCRFRLKDVLLYSRTRGTGKRTGLIGDFDRYLEFLKRSYEMHFKLQNENTDQTRTGNLEQTSRAGLAKK